ncbi:MAG: biotin/lipoyl-binding protein [Bacteroidales bacterium]|nr:biotin/lipoyl-binding protein [Bacteroidales bacterium]
MNRKKFHKILIANRGEIAVRIIRAIRELDKLAVVIHSRYDRDLPFVTMADEAFPLGEGSLSDTYLNIEKIIRIARDAHVDAIHPGYGFLSENAAFAMACRDAGIEFIGPSPDVIDLMGHKSNARNSAEKSGVPVLQGYHGSSQSLLSHKETYSYPLLVKPSGGGGGKGMRVVRSPEELGPALEEAGRESLSYFGSPELYLEKYLEKPRHIEVQVIADKHGNAVHLYERECSLQRRYQKIIEETPSAFLARETREKITESAIRLVRQISYTGAGTVEFLVDGNQEFFFLEMNTRIQVEHPVTEMVTGIDLVKEQINIAEGYPLSFSQEDIVRKGHAIEARLYAEDPVKGFMPSTGRIDLLEEPVRSWVRIDSGYAQGNLVEPYYDPMIAKVIVSGSNRDDARNHLIRALKDYRITGLTTNRDFLIELLRSDDFSRNTIHTKYLDSELETILSGIERARTLWSVETILSIAAFISLRNTFRDDLPDLSPWHQIGHWRMAPEIILEHNHKQYRIGYELKKGRERMELLMNDRLLNISLERAVGNLYWIRMDDQLIKVWGVTDRSDIYLDPDGQLFRVRRLDMPDSRYLSRTGKASEETDVSRITAPLHGKVVQINVKNGDEVMKGDTLLIIESMKMENKIVSPRDTTVKEIHVSAGEQVEINKLLITFNS